MALFKCKECGIEVSSKAETCPKCGARVAAKSRGCGTALGIIFLGIIISAFLSNFSSRTGIDTSSPPTNSSTASIAQTVPSHEEDIERQSATGEPPKGFRTAKWGSAPSGGLKKLVGPTSDGTSLYVPAPGKKPQPLFDIPVIDESYSYTRGKLYGGSATLSGRASLERMKAALTKDYGTPTFANEQLSIWKWKWPTSKIEVHLWYSAKFDQGTVTFLNNGM